LGNTFKEGVKGGTESITIINNNVNNFYNSVTHNHILKAERSPKEHQFRA
jgi:hypothetical protein